ncbi:MAG: metallophosphoesterase family protein [Chloroflexota bacterium]
MAVTLLHLSDLHFGPPLRPQLVDTVVREAHRLSPDGVVVSGDLTQRARQCQFVQAHHFLQQLPRPWIVIPGNHDVPLYNVFLRFFQPLGRYRACIHPGVDVALIDRIAGLSLVGLNSTRSFTIDGGRLRRRQLAWAGAQFAQGSEKSCRVVAVHHHFLPDSGHQSTIRQAGYLLRRFADMGVEMVLGGHRHWARAERAEAGPLVVQAGTATSRRGKGPERGENSFNVIEVDEASIRVTCHRYQAEQGRFAPLWTKAFDRLGSAPYD